MMKTQMLPVLLLLLLLLVIAGCDRRSINVPTDPLQVSTKDADRVLAFSYDSDTPLDGDYQIALYNTSRQAREDVHDLVALTLGDSIFDLVFREGSPFGFGWFSTDPHVLAGQTQVKLTINGSQVLSTTVVPVGKANAAFSAHYNYKLPLTLNWAVSGSSTYQFVIAESWDTFTVNDTLPFSQYIRRIPNNQASYTFPGHCVSLVDGDTTRTAFFLAVEEVNYKLVKRNAVMVYQEEGQWYYPSEPKSMLKAAGYRLKEIISSLSGR